MALEGLQHRGRAAGTAMPALAGALTSRVPGLHVVTNTETGVKVGPKDVTASHRLKVASTMVAIDASDPRTAPAHAWLLQNEPDPKQRMAAAMALGRLGSAAAKQVPVLVKALDDKSTVVAQEAVTALGMIGPPARPAVARLTELAEGKNRALAVRARAALKQIGN